MNGTTSNNFITQCVCINPFFFFFGGGGGPVFFSLFFFFVFFFMILSYVLFNSNVLGFKNKQVEKHQFLVKKGVATKQFFFSACVLQNVKSYYFLWQILVEIQNHYKINISAHFQTKNGKNDHIKNDIIWAKVRLLSGRSWCPKKPIWPRY